MKKPVLILGARSDIGRAIAHKFAALGHPIQLAARNVSSLDSDKLDIQLRYSVPVTLHEFDALACNTHEEFVTNLPELPSVAVSAIGAMRIQMASEQDTETSTYIMRSNFEGPANIMGTLANFFQERSQGTLVGISSVAGERGRAKNYIYGASKAGFTAYLSGLRNRMAKHDVHVITVLPGFVYTKMTEGMNLPNSLTAQPNEVAASIIEAISKKRDIVYVRPIWRLIMIIIRSIPERFFKKLNL